MAERRYDLEYERYQGTPEQIAKRSSRNKARRAAVKKYGASKIKGKDIDHKNGNPLDNNYDNLRPQTPSKNRSFARTKTARKKT
jgi:hypothetical protein